MGVRVTAARTFPAAHYQTSSLVMQYSIDIRDHHHYNYDDNNDDDNNKDHDNDNDDNDSDNDNDNDDDANDEDILITCIDLCHRCSLFSGM